MEVADVEDLVEEAGADKLAEDNVTKLNKLCYRAIYDSYALGGT